jgi:pyrrolidone-carboxylate peptidase
MPIKDKSGSAELFSRREAALLAGVPLKTVDKAIEEKVVKARRSRSAGTFLDADDVMALAVIGRRSGRFGAGFRRRSRMYPPRSQSFS